MACSINNKFLASSSMLLLLLLLLLQLHWISTENAGHGNDDNTTTTAMGSATDPGTSPGGGSDEPYQSGGGGDSDTNGILITDMLIDVRHAVEGAQEQLESIRASLSFAVLNQTQLQAVEALSLVEGLEALNSGSGSDSSGNSLNLATLNSIQGSLTDFNNVLSRMLGLNTTAAALEQVMASVVQLQAGSPPATYQSNDPERARSPPAALFS